MQDDDDLEPDRDIRDRLLRVENSLFLLKAKSRYFADWDNSEVERLERLRQDLRRKYDRSRASMPRAPSRRPEGAGIAAASRAGARRERDLI